MGIWHAARRYDTPSDSFVSVIPFWQNDFVVNWFTYMWKQVELGNFCCTLCRVCLKRTEMVRFFLGWCEFGCRCYCSWCLESLVSEVTYCLSRGMFSTANWLTLAIVILYICQTDDLCQTSLKSCQSFSSFGSSIVWVFSKHALWRNSNRAAGCPQFSETEVCIEVHVTLVNFEMQSALQSLCDSWTSEHIRF